MRLLCLRADLADLADPAERSDRSEKPVGDALSGPGWLSPTERARWAHLGSPGRREAFLGGRRLARRALRCWAGMDADPLLEIAPNGACRAPGLATWVSISHSGRQVACAVADRPVGVDIEQERGTGRPRPWVDLAALVQSPSLQARLRQAPDADARARAFLAVWTVQEAWLKARESGLDLPLMQRLDIADDPSGNAALCQDESSGLTMAVSWIPQPGLDGRPEPVMLSMNGTGLQGWRRQRVHMP